MAKDEAIMDHYMRHIKGSARSLADACHSKDSRRITLHAKALKEYLQAFIDLTIDQPELLLIDKITGEIK